VTDALVAVVPCLKRTFELLRQGLRRAAAAASPLSPSAAEPLLKPTGDDAPRRSAALSDPCGRSRSRVSKFTHTGARAHTGSAQTHNAIRRQASVWGGSQGLSNSFATTKKRAHPPGDKVWAQEEIK
jgi:hypothetical protein